MSNTTQVITGSYKNRDKYGRTVTHYTVNARTVAVLVTLPKVYAENHGHKYLVNDWASEKQQDVTYFVTRKPAVQHAEAIQAREAAKVAEAQAIDTDRAYASFRPL